MRCPVCGEEFSADFTEGEISQGGKNDYCPHCKWLLWIPIRGSPTPIPIPVHIHVHAQF